MAEGSFVVLELCGREGLGTAGPLQLPHPLAGPEPHRAHSSQ